MAELATVALVRSYLGDATADSTMVQAAIDAAETAIARECGRFDPGGSHWLTASHTEYIDGECAKDILLTFTPITAVASIDIINAAGSATSVTLTNVECDGLPISGLAAGTPGRVGRIGWRSYPGPVTPESFGAALDQSGPGWGAGSQRVKVVYTGGFATAPADLVQAAVIYAAQMYRDKDINLGVQSESLGDYSYTRPTTPFAKSGLATVMDLIRHHIRGGGVF